MDTSKNWRDRYYGPVIVIVGPTGSGKTSISIEIAKKIGGEIISADSRAIYKFLDLGTAKPNKEDMDGVKHFGIDLVEPGDRFTVADWTNYALKKIEEIRERGHVPMIVGGTGLYVDALVYNYQFNRDEQKYCSDRDTIRPEYAIFGVKWSSEELRQRLMIRSERMFTQDLLYETQYLVKKYGWDNQAMKSNAYQFAWKYLVGDLTLDEAVEQNMYADWHLAKRQMTWFKRNATIRWLPLAKISDAVIKCIQDE